MECQYFAKFALSTDIISETPSKYGLLSAVVAVSGSRVDEFVAQKLKTTFPPKSSQV
ncbi:hypothetical protein [Kingella negevensis]|uniref:hypothetical protein n=1 Tax=Kingella negevensis TaxID=1522312 RepID=UPI000AD6084E|nr:hypothetical protein [Kingella negevensis]